MIDVRIGDCRQLIRGLPDESVDMVMTSPPYWGLRDYKTEPIIFDGLPDCEHEWDDEISSRVDSTGFERNRRGLNKAAEIADGNPRRAVSEIPPVVQSSNFCSKCGAWRGQLGLEPTPELFIKHLLDFFDDVKLKLKAEGNCFVNLGDTFYGSGQDSGKQNRESSQDICKSRPVGIAPTKPPTTLKHNILKPKSLCMIPQRFAWGMINPNWKLRDNLTEDEKIFVISELIRRGVL